MFRRIYMYREPHFSYEKTSIAEVTIASFSILKEFLYPFVDWNSSSCLVISSRRAGMRENPLTNRQLNEQNIKKEQTSFFDFGS